MNDRITYIDFHLYLPDPPPPDYTMVPPPGESEMRSQAEGMTWKWIAFLERALELGDMHWRASRCKKEKTTG